MWQFVRGQLPPPSARVLEIGCGPLGGFVPALLRDGYRAVGIDPEAPEALHYHRVKFEEYEWPQPADVVVACTSLHHVADLDKILDRIAAALVPGGELVVIEWAWELFDEATARWCFDRLSPTPPGESGWLHRCRDEWISSGQSWARWKQGWAKQEGLHQGQEILRGLDARFERRLTAHGPYFFCDVDNTGEADEQAAIDTGQIAATRIQYTGRLSS